MLSMAGRGLGAFARASISALGELTAEGLEAGISAGSGLKSALSNGRWAPLALMAPGAAAGYFSADKDSTPYQKFEKMVAGGAVGLLAGTKVAGFFKHYDTTAKQQLANEMFWKGAGALGDRDTRAAGFKLMKKVLNPSGKSINKLGMAAIAGAIYGGWNEDLNVAEGAIGGLAAYGILKAGFAKGPIQSLADNAKYGPTPKGYPRHRFNLKTPNAHKARTPEGDIWNRLLTPSHDLAPNAGAPMNRNEMIDRMDRYFRAKAVNKKRALKKRKPINFKRASLPPPETAYSQEVLDPNHLNRDPKTLTGKAMASVDTSKNWMKENFTTRRAAAVGAVIGMARNEDEYGDQSLLTMATGTLKGGLIGAAVGGTAQGLLRRPVATGAIIAATAATGMSAFEAYQTFEMGGRVGFNNMEADGELALALHKIKHGY